MNWEILDWSTLDRLRDIFLAGKGGADYWRSRDDLVQYDATYGERIGWKWDAALRELLRLGWTPPSTSILDWGCGSGVAGRRVRDAFGIPTLRVFDPSRLAIDFACETGNATLWHEGEPVGLLVLSHVINEANPQELLRVARLAEAIIWVEPGTRTDSLALIAMREKLREEFHVVAPCTHRAPCGMLTPENDRHWCHFFAAPPKAIMANSAWVRFAQRAGIDLRSLPFSFLVLDRRPVIATATARLIGAPRLYKGYAKVLNCRADGVREETVQQRDAKELFIAWRKDAWNF